MQPYDHTEQPIQKGLFTFYREQQEFQKQLKIKSSAQNLNKLLSKALKNKYAEQQFYKNQGLSSLQRFQKLKSKLQPISQEKKNHTALKRQIKIKKAVINDTDGLKPQQDVIEDKKIKKVIKNQNPNKNLNNQCSINDSKNLTSSQQQLPQEFSKYSSQIDIIKIKKKKKSMIYSDSLPLSNRKSSPYDKIVHQTSNNSPNSKSNRHKQEQNFFKLKVSQHFKRLALEPKEFQSSEIISDQLNKNFVPISIKHNQKNGLKSYRQQKYKYSKQAPMQMRKKKYSQTFQASNKQTNHPPETKLIKIKKLQKLQNSCIQKDKQSIFSQKIDKQLILKKLKVNLPLPNIFGNSKNQQQRYNQLIAQKNISKNFLNQKYYLSHKQQTGATTPKQNHSASMSLQILKNFQLKNKYQLRNLQKQNSSILSTKQKLRNQSKILKQQKINHHISMRYTENNSILNSPHSNSIIQQNQKQIQTLNKNYLSPKNKSYEFQSINFNVNSHYENSILKNQGQIFIPRQKYSYQPKNSHKQSIININKQKIDPMSKIFTLQRQQRIKMQQIIQNKKQQIIKNLLDSFKMPMNS